MSDIYESTKSNNINELAAALAKAQAELEGAKKDSENPFFNSDYADLASVWAACREALTKNGLSVVQPTYVMDGKIFLMTMLIHTSGQWIRGVSVINPIKKKKNAAGVEEEIPTNDPQSIGSCITYMRRYTLAAMVGVAPADDDGNAASGNEGIKPAAKKTYPKANAGTAPDKEAGFIFNAKKYIEMMISPDDCAAVSQKYIKHLPKLKDQGEAGRIINRYNERAKEITDKALQEGIDDKITF